MRRSLALPVVVVLGTLAACAEVQTVPPPAVVAPPPARPAKGVDEIAKAVSKHRQLAQQLEHAGDLAEAAEHWQILALLLPDDDNVRRKLAETRAAAIAGAKKEFAAGEAALRAGDFERATQAMLATLALNPAHREAALALRDLEHRKLARVQADRAQRAKVEEMPTGNGRARPGAAATPANAKATYDLEQPLEMLEAGDVAGGLRELAAYVDAHPADRVARQRIGEAVYSRARALESKNAREQAISLYEQALRLRGEPVPAWSARAQALRKALSQDYYERGVRAYRSDIALAIRLWETSLSYDPQNLQASVRLAEGKRAEEKLKGIGAPAR